MLPDLLPDFTEFVPYLSFARRLFAACMALSSLAAASPCIVSVTCEYRSRVIPTEAWPNRTYLITQWLPNGISLLPPVDPLRQFRVVNLPSIPYLFQHKIEPSDLTLGFVHPFHS